MTDLTDLTDLTDFYSLSIIMPSKTTPTKSHARTPSKIYFLIITLVGLIGSVVAIGALVSNIGKQLIISDQEYILGDRYYEIESCKYNQYDSSEKATKPTSEVIAQCEEDKKEMLIQSRKVRFKENMINGTIRAIIFLTLLFIHYPRFIKKNKKTD